MRVLGALATGFVVTTLVFGLATPPATAQQLRGTPGVGDRVVVPTQLLVRGSTAPPAS